MLFEATSTKGEVNKGPKKEFWTPGYSPNNSILDPNYDLRRVYVFFVSGRPYIAATIPRLDTSQRVLQYEGVARFCRSQHGLSTQKRCFSCTCGFFGVGRGWQAGSVPGGACARAAPIFSARLLDPNYECSARLSFLSFNFGPQL